MEAKGRNEGRRVPARMSYVFSPPSESRMLRSEGKLGMAWSISSWKKKGEGGGTRRMTFVEFFGGKLGNGIGVQRWNALPPALSPLLSTHLEAHGHAARHLHVAARDEAVCGAQQRVRQEGGVSEGGAPTEEREQKERVGGTKYQPSGRT